MKSQKRSVPEGMAYMKVLGVTLSNLNKAVGLSTRRKQTAPAETGAVVRGQATSVFKKGKKGKN